MRLLRKSPPTKRLRISNFLSSTKVVMAFRMTSRMNMEMHPPMMQDQYQLDSSMRPNLVAKARSRRVLQAMETLLAMYGAIRVTW